MKAKRQAKKAERKSKRAERKYDESQAYNKNLSPEARLHYLENERADKDGASMYGKGPNAFGAAEVIAIASTLAPFVKPTLSGIESLGAGKKFSEGFKMNNKKSIKKEAAEFAKTDVGKGLKQKGMTALDKLIKESGKALKGVKMTGKEKGPNLMGMGKKETKHALGGAGLGMLTYGPIGAVAGGIAGKAFGKGRDRKEAEEGPDFLGMGKKETRGALGGAGLGMLALGPLGAVAGGLAGKALGKRKDSKEAEEGTGANMMGNSISKHMGGRGANMYGDGAEMLGMRKVRKESLKDMREYGENLRDIAMTPTRIISNLSNNLGGDDPQTPKEARQEKRQERRGDRQEKRQERRSDRQEIKLAKAKGPNMEGKKPMVKGENVIVRDAKSGGKNQYNKRGK